MYVCYWSENTVLYYTCTCTVWFFGGDIAVDNFVDFVRFTEIKITRFKYFYVNFVSKHEVFGAFLKYMYIF